MSDNKFGQGVGDVDPTTQKGVKGGVPLRAAPAHQHKAAKPPQGMGHAPTPATSDSQGKHPAGVSGPATNNG